MFNKKITEDAINAVRNGPRILLPYLSLSPGSSLCVLSDAMALRLASALCLMSLAFFSVRNHHATAAAATNRAAMNIIPIWLMKYSIFRSGLVSLLGRLAELGKTGCVIDGHLGEHLSVDLDAALLEPVHESAVADAVAFF